MVGRIKYVRRRKMKTPIYLLFFLLVSVGTQAQSARDLARLGNEAYAKGEYELAAEYYEKADSLSGNESIDGLKFNKGNAYYQQGDFEKAAKEFQRAVNTAESDEQKADAYHNLGNTYIENEDLNKGIEAYKKALRLDPTDEETRYNLSNAVRLMRKQQNLNQQEDTDEEGDEPGNHEGDNPKPDPDGDNQQKSNKEMPNDNQEKKPGEKPANEEGSDQPKGEAPKGQLSQEDAERMLKANDNKERSTQQNLRKNQLKGETKKVEKNW